MAPLLPALAVGARSLLARAVGPRAPQAAATIGELGPLAARALLVARDDDVSSTTDNADTDPSKGAIDPHNINNKAMFALFALIGVAFVVTGIWFFFWAKNGGFYFKETDWDDYKTTVLRRRGPNGTILSNATPSTNLGGGSVYKDVDDDDSTEYTGGLTTSHLSGDTGSTLSGITAGPSDIGAREKRRAKREKREREREKKKDRKARSGRKVGEDGALVDEKAEAEAKDAMRQYRHERPARVGGLNKESEGSTWDGSTNPSESTAGTESLLSGRQTTPTSTPTKSGGGGAAAAATGIRKVYSVADRNAAREQERIRAEARRLQDKGRASRSSAAASASRNFSFRQGDSIVEESVGRSEVSGASSGDLGTKAYHHPIPGLSSSASASAAGGTDVVDYAGERRKKRGAGYRRDRERRE